MKMLSIEEFKVLAKTAEWKHEQKHKVTVHGERQEQIYNPSTDAMECVSTPHDIGVVTVTSTLTSEGIRIVR